MQRALDMMPRGAMPQTHPYLPSLSHPVVPISRPLHPILLCFADNKKKMRQNFRKNFMGGARHLRGDLYWIKSALTKSGQNNSGGKGPKILRVF